MPAAGAIIAITGTPALVAFEIALFIALIAGAILIVGLVLSLVVFIYRTWTGDETVSLRADDFDPPSTQSPSTQSRVESSVDDEE